MGALNRRPYFDFLGSWARIASTFQFAVCIQAQVVDSFAESVPHVAVLGFTHDDQKVAPLVRQLSWIIAYTS